MATRSRLQRANATLDDAMLTDVNAKYTSVRQTAAFALANLSDDSHEYVGIDGNVIDIILARTFWILDFKDLDKIGDSSVCR